MGGRNFLVEGVSGTGKTSVCTELQRRGFHAVHGDRELAYQGDPVTGEPVAGGGHQHHVWHLGRVKALVADRSASMTFFCGGSRNFPAFIGLMDRVFVLDVDPLTLRRRLESRPSDEWGSREEERRLVLQLQQSKEDVPRNGVIIDATSPLSVVVDEILRQCGIAPSERSERDHQVVVNKVQGQPEGGVTIHSRPT